MTSELAILVLACAAWLNRAQDRRLRFLLIQNRVLREAGADINRMSDAHRRMLGEAAHGLSPEDLAVSSAFSSLHPGIQRWIYDQRWGVSCDRSKSMPSLPSQGRPMT